MIRIVSHNFKPHARSDLVEPYWKILILLREVFYSQKYMDHIKNLQYNKPNM